MSTRPLTLADAAAVHAIIAAEELHDLGEVGVDLEDVLADWQRPSYDLASSTLGVLDGERLVAYADASAPGTGYAGVHPDHRGRGIGTRLARWLEDVARARGHARTGSNVPQGSPADRLLERLGYDVLWTAWDLELPPDAPLPARPLPEGYALADAGADDRAAAYEVVETAFGEWRERRAYEDWGATVWGRPGYAPWHLRVLRDPGGVVVGATHVHPSGDDAAYLSKLAVRADLRGRGLATAMLADAFGLARAHGAVRCYLSTDTRAGALGLYERLGLVVTSTWVNRAKELAPRPS